jgi:hypothetical protein
MADITFDVVTCVPEGILDFTAHADVELGNAAAGDKFRIPNDGKVVLLVYGGTGDTFTFTAVNCSHGRTETLAPVVAVGDFAALGPFSPELWNQADGCVEFVPTAGNAGDIMLAVNAGIPS